MGKIRSSRSRGQSLLLSLLSCELFIVIGLDDLPILFDLMLAAPSFLLVFVQLLCLAFPQKKRLLSAVKGHKNDSRDAAAICEAVTRPHLRFVPLKTVESQDIQAIHRMRSRLIKERTALVNQIRGLLAERGIVIAQGITRLRKQLPILMEALGNELPPLSREVRRELDEQLVTLEERVTRADHVVRRVFHESAQGQKLAQSEGIGPVVATALVAAVGDARVFTHGRHLAAWLGVVPRQHSTGGKERLRGISKRGDRYRRTLLIHGARATGHRARGKTDARSRWIMSLEQRRGKHSATVASANTKARSAWALLTRDAEYRKAA